MAAQRMALGLARMVESSAGSRLMPRRSMTCRGSLVGRHRVGDDLGEPETAEPVIDRGACGLQGIAVPPIGPRQAPADLDRRL